MPAKRYTGRRHRAHESVRESGNRQIRKRTPIRGPKKRARQPAVNQAGRAAFSITDALNNNKLSYTMTRLRKFSSHPKFDKERRKHLLTDIMSNEGKKRLFILVMCVISYPAFALSPSTLRGGLVYQEKTTQGPVYVNVETVTLFRKADPSVLAESAQLSRTLGNRYQAVCRQVANRVTLFDKEKQKAKTSQNSEIQETYDHPFDIHFSAFKYPILDAPQVCKEMGGRRPEIRDKNSKDAIRFAAIKKGITKISAGVHYDAANNIFRFISDDVNVRQHSPFPFLEYGGYYEGMAYTANNWEDEYSVKQYAANYPIIYNHPAKDFVIRLGDNVDKEFKDYIMCEVPKPPPTSHIRNENNLLMQVTDHACKRDEQGLIAATNVIISEIEAITNLNVTLPEDLNSVDQFMPKVIQSYEFDEDKRRRRKRSNYQPKKKDCEKPRNRPVLISAQTSRKKKRKVLKKIAETHENWDTAIPDPTMVELYNNYRIRVKARYPTPQFHEWLIQKSLQLFYDDKDLKFDEDTKLSILYDLDLPKVCPYREHLLKKTARKTMTQLDIKNGATLYTQNLQFRNELDKQFDSLLLHYIQTHKIDGETTWERLQHLTHKRQKRAVTIVSKRIAFLYNYYQVRTQAGHIEPPFKRWLLIKSLALFYQQQQQTAFFTKHWTNIVDTASVIPITNYEMHEIQKAAAMQISKYEIKREAAKYAHATGHKEELDEQMIDVITMYITNDRIQVKDTEMTRLQFFRTITSMIARGYQIHSTSTTTTTTAPTTTTTTINNRIKRVAPLAAIGIGLGATAAVNAISSSITGDAPFSWGGKTIGTLFGLKTSNQEDLRQLQGVGQAMDDLKINQIEIASTINIMSRKMETIVSAVDGTFKATATMVIEQDLKMYIRHLLLVQQNAIQRYAHIMLAASVKQTSPFALSQKELDTTADELKMKKGIILARDLSSTRMTASIINNELYIQIEIPIVQENNLFNFYQIKPIPIFTGNLTLIPEVDATAIAISKTGSDYAVVTSEEFDNCINRPWKCHISTPIIPMSHNSHCVASTYVTQELKCPLLHSEEKVPPFFHIDGNFTIYSVPQATRLYVKCSESNLSNRYKDEAVTLQGMGEAVFKHSCTITLPTGAKFTTPAAKSTESTTDLKIFELLKIYPVPTGVTIKAHDSILPDNKNETALSLLEVQVPTKAQLTYEAFHPLRSIPFLIRMACIAAFVIVMVLAIQCFWPNIRSWLGRTWYCCCWGPTSDEQEEQRKEENSRRLQRLTDELNVIKQNTRLGAERWKQSTTSILSNIHKARSMSNLHNAKDTERKCQENLLESTDSLPPPPPLTPTITKNTRIVYKADPLLPLTKRVSFTNGKAE